MIIAAFFAVISVQNRCLGLDAIPQCSFWAAAVSAAAGITGTSAKHTLFSDTAAWNTFLCQL